MRSPSYPPQYGGYQNPVPPPGGPDDPGDWGSLLTPKTVVQLAVWILMFGLGAGLSGLILFVIYQGQINDLRGELLDSQEELRKSLEERIQDAPATQESPSLNVSGQPSPEDELAQIVENAAPAIVGITGRDSGGSAVSGTGFVVNNADSGTWVVTSYRLVAGVDPSVPQVSVRHENSDLIGEVYETDPGRDLALVIYHVSADRSLRFSRVKELKEGDPVWAIGHSRTRPHAVGIAAKLTRVSPTNLGLDVAVPNDYAGGPLLDADGRVLGVLSSTAVAGSTSTATPAAGGGSATTIEQVCLRILRCPSRNRDTGNAQARATPTPSPSGSAAPAAPPPPPSPGPTLAPGDLIQPPISNPNTADVPIG